MIAQSVEPAGGEVPGGFRGDPFSRNIPVCVRLERDTCHAPNTRPTRRLPPDRPGHPGRIIRTTPSRGRIIQN